MAKLYFRYGAMNCGKTALLLQAVHNYEARGMKVLVLKPIVDSKGGKTIVSRIGLKREVDHLIKNTEDMFKYLSKNIINISCIFIDEAQFLKRKQEVTLTILKPIICNEDNQNKKQEIENLKQRVHQEMEKYRYVED